MRVISHRIVMVTPDVYDIELNIAFIDNVGMIGKKIKNEPWNIQW